MILCSPFWLAILKKDLNLKRREIKILDGLWAEKVKRRAGYKCEKCSKPINLHSHHAIPRTNYALRWDLENGCALCYRCHIHWAHKDALDFYGWIKGKRNIRYLESLRYDQSKKDYEKVKKYLEKG